MIHMKKVPFILGSAFVALVANSASPMSEIPKPVVEVGSAVLTQDTESRRYTGQVVSISEVRIVPRVSGEILEVGFADGSVVEAGQMLYRLDPIQYEAAVKSAEAKIAECKAKLEYADHNYNRNLTLYEKQATSRDLLENTKKLSLNNSKFSINYNRCGKV